MKPTILVTGASGQLGCEFRDIAGNYPQLNFVFLSRKEASITDAVAIKHAFDVHKPGWVINCAAYTAVDKAESEQEFAFEVNGNAVGHLAYLSSAYKAGFIHFSTDYVFNGRNEKPWKETDDTDPVNAYGASKLQGEFKALKNNPDSIIIRTSWVYSSHGKNFVKTMLRLMQEKESINVVNDQLGCPTYAADLALAVMKIITSDEMVPGIFHYCNKGEISWYDFAREIKEMTGASCQVLPISSEQYLTPAKRPAYSVLDTSAIREAYDIEPRNWKEALNDCLSKLKPTS